MKKSIFLIGVLIITFSCSKAEPKDYATLSGKIDNSTTKEIVIKSRTGSVKKISINEDGTFSDTLHVKDKGDLFRLLINGRSQIFLKNDDDIKISGDAKKLKETINFSGKGSETSSYIAEKLLYQSQIAINELFKLDKATFEKKVNEITTKLESIIEKHSDMDTAFSAEEKTSLKKIPGSLTEQYNKMKSQNNSFTSLEGKPSPNFTNYENYKGGKTSLKDLRGKYVYIDVWATWCRPCLGEIPHLQKLEKEFEHKNIQFVSISVDKESAKSKWKKMISDKKMRGIQLFAKQGDTFAKEFRINSIPRFILLDPKGNVVKSNAPRPSSPGIKKILTELIK